MKHLQKEERARALKALNDIQHDFSNSVVQYEKRGMDEFWNAIESLDLLFGLSNKILEEELITQV